MRRYLTYIVKSDVPGYPEECVIISPKRDLSSSKGRHAPMHIVNVETREKKDVEEVVGLGHVDFKDEKDEDDRIIDVVNIKLKEVGLGHLVNKKKESE